MYGLAQIEKQHFRKLLLGAYYVPEQSPSEQVWEPIFSGGCRWFCIVWRFEAMQPVHSS
jgi:hypothetical protein